MTDQPDRLPPSRQDPPGGPGAAAAREPDTGSNDLGSPLPDRWFSEAFRADAPPDSGRDAGSIAGGERCGHYVIDRELGRGGQATVYLAQDERLGRRVALKVLDGLGSAEAQTRFAREAEVASRLSHPNVCTVFETGRSGGRQFIAMEYVEGGTLAARIRERRRDRVPTTVAVPGSSETETAPEAGSARDGTGSSSHATTRAHVLEMAALIEKVARAVHAAHEAGVLHRDLKPGNIMVDSSGEPKLSDFGLARQQDSDQPSLTRTGDLFGTPAYMSPEQLTRQTIRLDRRSDVWSLGVTLYESLTLQAPFRSPTREGLYQAILSQEPANPRRLNPAVPRDLAVVLETALQKDRSRRYQTALDLADDLARVQRMEPILARPVSWPGRILRWMKRRPYQAASAFLTLVVAAAAIALLVQLPGLRDQRTKARLQDLAEERVAIERRLQDAFLCLHEDHSGEAVPMFADVLTRDPRHVEGHAGYVMALRDSGRRAAAEEWMQRHRGLFEGNPGLAAVATEERDRPPSQGRRPGIPPPVSASDHFLAGYLAIRKDFDHTQAAKSALAHLTRAVLLTHDRPRLLYHVHRTRAATYSRSEETASECADVVVALWPDDAYAWYARAQALGRDDQREAQIAALERAVSLRPDSPLFLGNLADALRGAGRAADAERLARRVLELNPRRAQSWYQLGLVLVDQKRREEAIEAFERCREIDAGHRRVQLQLGQALIKAGRVEEGIAACREVVEGNPGDPRVLISVSLVFRTAGRLDHAEAALRDALRLDGEHHQAHHQLGDLLAFAGRFEESMKAFDDAVRTGADCANVHYQRGQVARRLGRPEEAVSGFRKSLALQDRDAQIYRDLGETLHEMRRYPESAQAFQSAIELVPGHPGSHIGLGLALEFQGKLEEAVAAYRKSLDLRDTAHGHCRLGHSLQKSGRLEEALKEFREAARLDPDHVESPDPQGQVLKALGRFDEAVPAFERTSRLAPAGSIDFAWADRLARLCRRYAGIDGVLARVSMGEGLPEDPSEVLLLAEMAYDRARYRQAATWWREAFARSPAAAGDLDLWYRYFGACSAVLTAAGPGSQDLDAGEREAWRRQALEWLRADLAAWKVRLGSDPSAGAQVARALRHWLLDMDLPSVRDADGLDALPAAERKAWEGFWEEVRSEIRNAGAQSRKAEGPGGR